ncbi:MAG: hypothetical protein GIW95_10820 [Candidatus Eremiobacteraeota bacterium]|nr:hypothetical protein [Candidatus Eremiobacteraeota bacterium]
MSAVLQRLAENPAAPEQYSADVKLHVRLRVFPWISLTLNGNQVYKHPGIYRFAFRGVPKAAEQFSNMAYALGDASGWPDKYEIALLPAKPSASAGRDVLRLTPKVRGLVKYLDVTVDSATRHIEQIAWSRYDGGTINLTQHYQTVAAREIVAQQEASIRIPHMSADLVANYTNFNVPHAVAAAPER